MTRLQSHTIIIIIICYTSWIHVKYYIGNMNQQQGNFVTALSPSRPNNSYENWSHLCKALYESVLRKDNGLNRQGTCCLHNSDHSLWKPLKRQNNQHQSPAKPHCHSVLWLPGTVRIIPSKANEIVCTKTFSEGLLFTYTFMSAHTK